MQYSLVQCGKVQKSTVQCFTVQYTTVQCSVVQCSAINVIAIQCSTYWILPKYFCEPTPVPPPDPGDCQISNPGPAGPVWGDPIFIIRGRWRKLGSDWNGRYDPILQDMDPNVLTYVIQYDRPWLGYYCVIWVNPARLRIIPNEIYGPIIQAWDG